MNRRSRSGLSRAERFGVSLIAVFLAVGLLLGRGGLGVVVRDARGASERLLESVGITRSAGATSSPGESSEPPPTLGHLGEPPRPRLVYPHLRAGASEGTLTAEHSFTFESRAYAVAVEVDAALYEAAGAAVHRMSEVSGESEAEMKIAYYRYMMQDREQAPLIAQVTKQLRTIAKRQKLDRDSYAELIAKYVQSMPYDVEKAATLGAQDQFPVETLVLGSGVCGDKSLLMAALLAHEGYDVALLLFDAEKHMAVGIAGPGSHYGDSGYLFVEATMPALVSEVPETFVSGIVLESDPLVIPVGEGSRGYGAAKSVARIISVREAAHEAGESLVKEASRRPLTREEAADVNRRIDLVNESQYMLGTIKDHEDERLDRTPALGWVDRNAWWE